MIYGDFPSIPLILVITLQENPVLRILAFQEPSRTQIDLEFFGC
jgi:hypothetical protein